MNNGDKIRQMTNEELATTLLIGRCPSDKDIRCLKFNSCNECRLEDINNVTGNKIRKMSNKELAEFVLIGICPHRNKKCINCLGCIQCRIEWLNNESADSLKWGEFIKEIAFYGG